MNFGFVKAALKAVGKAGLTLAEDAGPAAAAAFGGPLAGTLANIAVQGILAAQAKHGPTQATPMDAPVGSTAVSTGLTKKLDAMQYLESQAGIIANLVLESTGRPVADPARFADGVNLMVEGLVDVMKAINAIPAAQATPVAPVVAPIPTQLETSKSAAPISNVAVVPTPFVGAISGLDVPPAKPDVIALLQQVLTALQPKVAA